MSLKNKLKEITGMARLASQSLLSKCKYWKKKEDELDCQEDKYENDRDDDDDDDDDRDGKYEHDDDDDDDDRDDKYEHDDDDDDDDDEEDDD